jgi:ABC-2 type transport system ATP-binding protein
LSDVAIVTEDLTRGFRTGLALDGLSLEVPSGEVLALLGPNGAGKTTTIRLLNGVLLPDRGACRVLGFDPTVDGDEVRRRTGVLTEHAGLDERLTAHENLVFTARMRGIASGEADRRTTELLERFDMANRAHDLVQGFSTGQRKRLALARALLHRPEVLFLDEPTSGLDPAATRDVIDLIGTLATEHGRTIVLCTHFLGEAGRLANRMAVLHKGHLHAFGRPEDIAADLWHGLDADIDLGEPGTAEIAARVGGIDGVLAAEVAPSGLAVRVVDRAVLPRVVAALVASGCDVYAAVPRPPTLEDVYFAVEARISGTAAAVEKEMAT